MGTAKSYSAIVIGGGASGLAAALTAARRGLTTCIIERDVACGLKILATGNGRCNLSNTSLDTGRYLDADFAARVLGPEPERELERFFESLGILTTREGDRLYPHSLRAESVRDALLDACRRAGVDVLCGASVAAVAQNGGAWTLTVRHPAGRLKVKPQPDHKSELRARRRALRDADMVEEAYSTPHVVIAVGDGIAGLASRFGLSARPLSPVLCPVEATVPGADDALDALNGLRARTRVTLRRDRASIWHEDGEVLFRPFGVSGVVIFNLSRRVRKGDTVLVDFFPDLDRDAFHRLLIERSRIVGPFSANDPSWFDGLVAPALGRVACEVCRFCHPGSNDVAHLVNILKKFKLDVTGLATDQPAQVSRGGVPLDAVDARTLACRDPRHAGLSVCGEALDMDADCGGFNLAWAWLSGIRAACAL